MKDNKTKTGRGPMRFLFFDSIDEILGTAPNICSTHSLNVSSEPIEQTQSQFSENSTEIERQPAAIMNENYPKRDEIIFESTEESTRSDISNDPEQNRNRPTKKKKTNLMKLREEIADLKKKTKEKKRI